ncbi:MAG: hypothetical protein U0L07_07735, partial [Clostridia bacterium]|nr:hypothetical protein [Clostridia bacterium]
SREDTLLRTKSPLKYAEHMLSDRPSFDGFLLMPHTYLLVATVYFQTFASSFPRIHGLNFPRSGANLLQNDIKKETSTAQQRMQ